MAEGDQQRKLQKAEVNSLVDGLPLALGWIQLEDGGYQHLYSRVCAPLPPYRLTEQQGAAEHHEASPVWHESLLLGKPPPAPPTSESAAPSTAPQPTPPASSGPSRDEAQGSWMPSTLDWTTVDLQDKTPVNILNELGPKAWSCYPEFTPTQVADPTNPYQCTIVMEGIVIAKGAGSSKKKANLNAARAALHILMPLIRLAGPVDQGRAGSFLRQEAPTAAEMASFEDFTLALPFDDDRILDCSVGKTPIMVLQEHCHKHVGQTPTYTDVTDANAPRASRGRSGPRQFTYSCRSGALFKTATDITVKKSKQRVALAVLRALYPHVKIWGDLVNSMTSAQRERRALANASGSSDQQPCTGRGVLEELPALLAPWTTRLGEVKVLLWEQVALGCGRSDEAEARWLDEALTDEPVPAAGVAAACGRG